MVVYPLDIKGPIFNLTIGGQVTLNKESSFLRVILIDKNDGEYLVYETYPLLAGLNSFIVNDVCEETCLLDKVEPRSLRIEGYQSTFGLGKVSSADSLTKLSTQIGPAGITAERERLRAQTERTKIAKINEQIKAKNMNWQAGETPLSKLTYSQKKKLFQDTEERPVTQLPNLRGYEYYKGGIFELRSDLGRSDLGTMKTLNTSLLPTFWDWRNVHAENWMTPVKNQGMVCESCWAFSAAGAVEAVANLYFNQHLDFDLSEQELVSCSQAGNCSGGWHKLALAYIKEKGVAKEECFPYQGADAECSLCSGGQKVRIADSQYVTVLVGKEDLIKKEIITKGPLSARITFLRHAAVLVGWETDLLGDPVWVFKDSWGTFFGEQGYLKMKMPTDQLAFSASITTPVTLSSGGVEIACVDKDRDSYCNWGISETKPSTCPVSCRPQKDCDDSKPGLGPFDQNFNCQPLVIVTPSPAFGGVDNRCAERCKPGFYCKCEALSRDEESSRGGCYCVKE